MAGKGLKGSLGIFVSLSVLLAAGIAGARGTLFTGSLADDAMEVVEEADPCAEAEPLPEEGEAPGDEGGSETEPTPEPTPTESAEGEPEGCQETPAPPVEVDEGEAQGEGDQAEGESPQEEGAPQVVDGDRDAACDAAAGIEDSPLPEETKLIGLENAISHVLENCKKNPQAPGLLNALERLAENRARKEVRDEAKAERKAEHDARKAAKKAGKPQKNGGGPPAHAGPPHGGGPPSHAGGGKGKG